MYSDGANGTNLTTEAHGLLPFNPSAPQNLAVRHAGPRGARVKREPPSPAGLSTTMFLRFPEALRLARSLGLADQSEWRAWCKDGMRPPNIPAGPDKIYKEDGWRGWRHWLGTGTGNAKNFLPFGEASAYAQALGLINWREWAAWCKKGLRPPNVPARPDLVYKDTGWQGYGHWLGTGNRRRGKVAKQASASNQRGTTFLPFAEALAVARSLGMAGAKEWYAWSKKGRRPLNVPAAPDKLYKGAGWLGWGHWLGTGNQASQAKTAQFLPFDEALAVARSLGLAFQTEWRQWCKEGRRPPNVPAAPSCAYKDSGWQGWDHWLGSGDLTKASKFAPFAKALTIARSLGLASSTEWEVWCKEGMRPPNVPSRPDRTYEDDGWQGWDHWLGSGMQHDRTQKGACDAVSGPIPMFVDADHGPATHLEVLGVDGETWRAASAYQHSARGNVVLWYGGAEYEGLEHEDGGYRWSGSELLDGDGDLVPTRKPHNAA